MKRALLHIGPHQTGADTIQTVMHANAHMLSASHQFLPTADPHFTELRRLTHGLRTPQDVAQNLQAIYDASFDLARSLGATNTLISSPDLLGPMPTMAGISGLYPFLEHTLPAIQAGFDDGEVDTQFFGYTRNYREWMQAIHAHKFRDRERTFAPRAFRKRNELPKSWKRFVKQVHASVGENSYIQRSYETDVVSGRMGTDMFRYFGIPQSVLDNMNWAPYAQETSQRSQIANQTSLA